MPAKWNKDLELRKFKELYNLYITQNKTIGEIGKALFLSESTVYDRLIRLGIKPNRTTKKGFNNKSRAAIPCIKTRKLAEFFGIMLGDGCLTPTQTTVTLGNKEHEYVKYVSNLISDLFNIVPKILTTKRGYYVIYFGSVKIVKWLLSNNLVFNKVKGQVKPPEWVSEKKFRMEGFLKGMFDTDGSVYKLRYGVQIAFINRSIPLLQNIKDSLEKLGYHPSNISLYRVFLTRKKDVFRFMKEIAPANLKHRQRFEKFVKYYSI